ncbi:permease [Halomicroarcula sp. GCM10025817]|uniref:DUF7139 domain-containing protein n=1 Tax=Haloarcula TaxID=2237 RepID=UPI0023E8C23E|nr:hypothetical protein [Halomicroarcula sp. SYNS111]
MTDQNADGRLFEWYRRYIGEPDREVDVYVGFALFFGGIGLGIAAFLISAAGQFAGAEGYVFREAAFAVGMIALPATLSSVIVLLPVGRRAVYGGVVGSVVCLAGMAFFVFAYPFNWASGPGPQYAIHVMFVYGAGLTALLASTGGALVAYHVERARPGPGDIEGIEDDESETVSDEDIERDIEEAMANVDITWGGVERHEGTALKLNSDLDDMDTSGMDVEADRVHRSSVDTQVNSLQSLKGGKKQSDRSTSTVDDQTDRLQELRQRQREEAEQTQDTLLERVLARIAAILN